MAWSSSYLPLASWQLYAADKPVLLASQAVTEALMWNGAGGTDRTDPNYPTSRATDWRAHVATAPTNAYAITIDELALIMEVDPGASFDTLAILGHNLGGVRVSEPPSVWVRLEICDEPTFTSPTLIYEKIVHTSERIVCFELNDERVTDVPNPSTPAASGDGVRAKIFTGVAYAKVRLATYAFLGAWDFEVGPRIGEVILGQRRQLAHYPDLPWDSQQTRTLVAESVSLSGARTRIIRAQGQHYENATLTFNNSAEAEVYRSAFVDSAYGGRPLLWTPHPYSAPQKSYFGFMPPELSIALQGPFKRQAPFVHEETIPFVSSEAV